MLITGNQRPRLSCFPPYVYSSAGTEANELAGQAGLILDDWQSWSLDNILSVRKNGKWAAFENLEIVGRQNGKDAILEARELAGLFIIKTDAEILHTAHEFKTAIKHFYRLKFLIENTPELDHRVMKINESHGQEFIKLMPTPTLIMGSDGKFVSRSVSKVFEIIARSQGSGRGFTADLLIYNEAMILDAVKVGATLPTLSARPNPQVIYMASAGFKTSTQLAKVRRRGVSGNARSLFFAEWSIDPHDEYCAPGCTKHDDPGTELSYRKSNPTYNIRIFPDYLENEREAFEGGEDEWLRERLGVGAYPAPFDAWLIIPKKWYDDALDDSESPPRLANRIFAVDVPPDRGWGVISVSGERSDGLAGIEIVDRKPGTKWLIPRIFELHEKWHPKTWVIDPRSAAGSLIDDMEKNRIPVERMSAQDVAHSCGQIFDGFRDSTLRHLGQKPLRDALAGADKRTLSEAWAFDRRNSAVDLSPLMSATFAYWGYMKFCAGFGYEIRESVHLDLEEITRMVKAGAYGIADLERLQYEGLLSGDDIADIQKALRGT